MNQVGIRIFFDYNDGEILLMEGEMFGDVLPRKQVSEVRVLDLEYGSVDLSTHEIVGVDVSSDQPIIREIRFEESAEQRHIRELEDALLLQTENEIGGIL